MTLYRRDVGSPLLAKSSAGANTPMTTRRIKNPKELLEFLFGNPAHFKTKPKHPGAYAFGLHAEFAVQLDANFDRLRETAQKTIRNAGFDPAHCHKLARERRQADAIFWAAQILLEVDRIQQYLARMGPSGLEAALAEVLSSLAFVGQYHALAVAAPEPAAAASSADKAAPKKGQATGGKSDLIALQLAKEFKKRQHARDVLAGALVGFPRPSDAELKRQIGAELGLTRSAAIDAINQGLAILSAMGASVH